MNLDEQFRAALNQEADMQTPTRPDIDNLISGGRTRRRNRRTMRIGIAAAAALVVGGVYGVMHVDRGDTASQPRIATQPSQSSDAATSPPPYQDLAGALPSPGTYRKTVGYDASSGTSIGADLTFEGQGWYSGDHP